MLHLQICSVASDDIWYWEFTLILSGEFNFGSYRNTITPTSHAAHIKLLHIYRVWQARYLFHMAIAI
jgi:hypothetical protein